MSKFVTYPAVTVLDNDHSLLIDSPNAGTNSISADNAADTLLSKWSGFDTFDEAVQNTISNSQEFIDRDTAIRGEIADLKRKIVTTFPAKEASGQIATFESEFEDAPLKSCIVQIEPVQSGSGDPSPDNVRPISGWTGCEVQRTGKNFANAKFGTKVPSISNGQMVNVSGWSTEYIKVDNSKTYSASAANDRSSYVFYYDHNLNYLGSRIFAKYVRVDTESYFSGASYIKLRNDAAENNDPHIQLELGSATPYEPYHGETYPVTFPTSAGTVYGGYVDVTGGELVVDRYYGTIDNKKVGISTNSNGYFWYTTLYSLSYPSIKSDNAKLIANRLRMIVNTKETDPDGVMSVYANGTIRWKEKGELTRDEYKAYLIDNPLYFCYELAEPIHYSLTPTEIKTLLGTNNIWADTGDIAVEYLMSDVSWYVEKKLRAFQSILAGVEDSAVASKNYSTNSYLIFNDDIYRVTKTITSGETIEDGVNVTKTTVAEQLMALAQA